MSDDRHWSDPRWGDPATRAHVDGGEDATQPAFAAGEDPIWAAPAEPQRAPRRLTPLLAGLIGLVLGGAVGVPVGLVHHQDSDRPAPTAAPPVTVPGAAPAPASTGDVAGKIDPSIVDITSRLGYQRAVAAGTGMVITANGDVLTNNHVIEGATSITATSVISGRTYTATVVGTDPTQDVAVIHLSNASGLPPIPVGDSRRIAIGDAVVALGNAGGRGGTPAVATGSVTALDQQITATDSNGTHPQHLTGLIETDAPIQPGDSGGPLSDSTAHVVGMDTAASAGVSFGTASGRGFAIRIEHALAIAHEIESGRGSSTVHIGPRGMIGVQVADVSTGAGADVVSVTAGSPADKAGIHSGDTITAIDGHPVNTSDSLGTLIKAHHAGERVSVSWTTSSGTGHTATVTLVVGPPD